MATRVDVEEIQTTKSEKLLAVVLAIFILIGSVWAYQEIDDAVRPASGFEELAPPPPDDPAVTRYEQAQEELLIARQRARAARDELELRREAYRTALDEGRRAPALERAYRGAQRRLARADAALADAREAVRAARPEYREAVQRANEELSERESRHELYAFLLRLLFVAALLAAAYWLLGRLRARNSRYLLVAFSLLGAAVALALVLAGDYITDYIDPLDLGPLVLSLFGIALTLVAFAALQRYLARRLPYRRVRKRECPFCGFPVRANRHCEGCGRAVVAACSHCGQDRRVGTLHCGLCGYA